MNKRLTVATALSLVLLTHSTQADVGSDMNNFFTDMGYASNVTPPGVYEGQAAGYFTGGGLTMRAPSRNYYLGRCKAYTFMLEE